MLWGPSRLLAIIGAAGNLTAAVFWAITRTSSVGWIDGLERREPVGLADAAAAGLAFAAAVAAALALTARPLVTRVLLTAPAVAVAAFVTLVAVGTTATDAHVHSADEGHTHDVDDGSGVAANAAGGENTDGQDAVQEHGEDERTSEAIDDSVAHEHGDDPVPPQANDGHGEPGHDMTTMWPRPWDPSQPIDLSGVVGVTKQQKAFGVALIASTMRDLPTYASYQNAIDDGYVSIKTHVRHKEHLLKPSLLADGKMLTSSAPESLFYWADGKKRTLAAATYIVEPGYKLGSDKLNSARSPSTTCIPICASPTSGS
jgi:hypothetical protein